MPVDPLEGRSSGEHPTGVRHHFPPRANFQHLCLWRAQCCDWRRGLHLRHHRQRRKRAATARRPELQTDPSQTRGAAPINKASGGKRDRAPLDRDCGWNVHAWSGSPKVVHRMTQKRHAYRSFWDVIRAAISIVILTVFPISFFFLFFNSTRQRIQSNPMVASVLVSRTMN